MKTGNQLTFNTYQASLELKPNKILIGHLSIPWPLVDIHLRVAEGYDHNSLFKAQLPIYLGDVSSNRKLASALKARLPTCVIAQARAFSMRFSLRNLVTG